MYTKTKSIIWSAALAIAAVMSGGASEAATFTSDGTCSVTDVSATADNCFGQVLPAPVNDSADLLNNNTFGTDSGLFGITTWSFLAKQDTPGGLSGTNIGLSVTPTGGAQSGSWSVDAGALDIFKDVVMVLKASNRFTAYLYSPGANAGDGGTWSTSGLTTPNGSTQPNLSHFAFYTSGLRDSCPNGGTPPFCNNLSEVPVPASLPLLLAGLGMVGIVARRRRKFDA